MNEIELILRNLDQAFGTKAWHGTNLRGSVRGLSLAEVTFRPRPGRHSIWELTVHCAYWKYTVRRRLTGEKRGSFPHAGSNFFPRPGAGDAGATESAWRADLKLLDQIHASLRAEIEQRAPKWLDTIPAGTKFSNRDALLGIAAHDLYHAGQIQLLKRLARAEG
jgi:uncharacterized damage-inducible protein DinB